MSEMKIETIVRVDGKKFDSVAAAEAYIRTKKFQKRINAWMDLKGMSTGKGNRRAATLALISDWEADIESGLMDTIDAQLEAAAADAAEAAKVAEAAAQEQTEAQA